MCHMDSLLDKNNNNMKWKQKFTQFHQMTNVKKWSLTKLDSVTVIWHKFDDTFS